MSARTCPACGQSFPSGAEGGLCPRCLLGLAGEGVSETSDEGRRFGDYELEAEIARGGMGVIYRARHVALDRVVAVKMVSGEGLRSASGRMRFQIEAEAIASLDHSNIVSLFEYGEHEGQLFYSMQLVSGGTLADELRSGQAKLRDQITRLLKVARAVEYAHSKGILHRDLKPSNILMDADGEPFLADFGLAKREDGDLELTRAETVMGSPNYMAPEQARGSDAGAISTSTDIYSLGAILYEILCGAPPFRAETAVETLRRVIDEEARFPSGTKAIDPDLRIISQKCLEKNPRSRYRSAAALADDLQRWLQGEALEARPLGRVERLSRWVRKEPVLAGALCSVAIMLIGVALISSAAYLRVQGANASLKQANEQTAQQLYQSQLREADDLFEKGQSSEAMALMGKLGRDWPHDERLMHRIRNILNYQAIPILASPLVHLTGGTVLDWTLVGQSHIQVVLASGEVLQVDQSTGEILPALYRAGSEITKGSIGTQSLDVAMLLEDESLLVVDCSGTPREQRISHDGQVTHLALSPDGSRIGIVEDWRRLTLRSVVDGRTLGGAITLPHSAAVIEFSDDGALFAVGLSRGGSLVCDAVSGSVLEHLEEQIHSYHDLAFGGRNRMMGFASPGGALAFWDRDLGRRIESGEYDVNWRINGVELSPDGQRALAFDSGGSARLIHLVEGRVEHAFGHMDFVSCGAFDSDGKAVLTGSHDRTVRVWDAESGRSLSYPLSHTSGIQALAFGNGPGDVRVMCYDGTLWRWQVGSALLNARKSNPGRVCQSAAYIRSKGWVALGMVREDGRPVIRLLGAEDGNPIKDFVIDDLAGELSVDAKGERMAFRVGSRIEVRNLSSGELVMPAVEIPFGGIESVDLNPSGQRVAFASQWEAPRIVSVLENGNAEGSLGVVGTEWIQFSPDGRYVATSNGQVGCELWNVGQQKRVAMLASSGRAQGFSPDGRYVSILNGETAYLVDRKTLHWIPGEIRHDSHIESLVFSPDSRWVATASRDETVQVWRIEADQLRFVTQLWHHSAVNSVAFSSEGECLVTGTEAGQVRLWDSASGFPLSEWLRHDDAILQVAVDSDDEWFSAVSKRGTLSTWPIAGTLSEEKAWLPDLLEYLGRHRINGVGRAVSLSLQEMALRRDRLLTELENNPNSSILRRFLSARFQEDTVTP